MVEGRVRFPAQFLIKTNTMAYTFKVYRTYETIIEIEADNYVDALLKFSETDIPSVELEQCCVVEELTLSDHGEVDETLLNFVKKHLKPIQ